VHVGDILDVKMVKKVVIVGGGTAGWIAAAALSRQLGTLLDITLIESDDIGTVGVGEASIPTMRNFHSLAGIDEAEFMKASKATFKLGIKFENWGNLNESYIHSFGTIGKTTWMAGFHHFWLHAVAEGYGGSLGEYCLEHQAALAGKFSTSEKGHVNYAYHLDASLYAKYLRGLAAERSVRRVEGKVQQVKQNTTTGFIESVVLASGREIEGDLFIDCSGFQGLLIEKTLETGYEDWSHWLASDSAVAVQTKQVGSIPPYTRSIAHDAGWRWQIPLQTRVGNGLVYSSQYLSDDEAKRQLLENVGTDLVNEPRVIKFTTGKRKKSWNKNCVALGLSSGFLEPLESTSIHLIMIGVTRLMQIFPFDGVNDQLIDNFNAATDVELARIRDFIILHYKATNRDDSEFWRHCKSQSIPDSLRERLELFKSTGHINAVDGDIFRVDSWLQVMLGQGIKPQSYHHVAKMMQQGQLQNTLLQLKGSVEKAVGTMPTHQEFINSYCRGSSA